MILQALYEYYQRKAADPGSTIAPHGLEWKEIPYLILIDKYNPQNKMFRLLGTKRSFSQNETFFFSHPYPALFRLISHF